MDFLLLTLFYGALSVILWKVFSFFRNYAIMCRKLRRLPQRSTTHWLFGNQNEITDSKSYLDTVVDMVKTKGVRLYCIWIGPIPVVGVTHPSTCKELIHAESRKARGFTDGYRLMEPWIGDGLILSSGKKWERNRKLLTPAFHFDILKGYISVMNDVSTIFMDKLWNDTRDDKFVDVTPYVCRATLDAVLRCSLSYEGCIQNDEDNDYLKAVKGLSKSMWDRMLRLWLMPDIIFYFSKYGRENRKLLAIAHQFTGRIIRARRDLLKEHPDVTTGKRRLDFLDILLAARDDNGQALSPQEVQDEVDTFTFAGHDTTASALTFAIYSLAKYPDIQEKVFQDVHSVLENRMVVNIMDIGKFEYLPLFLKEVLRYYSPVPLVARKHTETIVLDGYEIPPGPRLDINIYAMHHHTDIWPDHKAFDPDRFSFDHRDETENFGFIPFSAGSRNCIGQQFALNELKITLAKLVNRFEVIADPDHEFELLPDVVMRSTNGVKLGLKKRGL